MNHNCFGILLEEPNPHAGSHPSDLIGLCHLKMFQRELSESSIEYFFVYEPVVNANPSFSESDSCLAFSGGFSSDETTWSAGVDGSAGLRLHRPPFFLHLVPLLLGPPSCFSLQTPLPLDPVPPCHAPPGLGPRPTTPQPRGVGRERVPAAFNPRPSPLLCSAPSAFSTLCALAATAPLPLRPTAPFLLAPPCFHLVTLPSTPAFAFVCGPFFLTPWPPAFLPALSCSGHRLRAPAARRIALAPACGWDRPAHCDEHRGEDNRAPERRGMHRANAPNGPQHQERAVKPPLVMSTDGAYGAKFAFRHLPRSAAGSS